MSQELYVIAARSTGTYNIKSYIENSDWKPYLQNKPPYNGILITNCPYHISQEILKALSGFHCDALCYKQLTVSFEFIPKKTSFTITSVDDLKQYLKDIYTLEQDLYYLASVHAEMIRNIALVGAYDDNDFLQEFKKTIPYEELIDVYHVAEACGGFCANDAADILFHMEQDLKYDKETGNISSPLDFDHNNWIKWTDYLIYRIMNRYEYHQDVLRRKSSPFSQICSLFLGKLNLSHSVFIHFTKSELKNGKPKRDLETEHELIERLKNFRDDLIPHAQAEYKAKRQKEIQDIVPKYDILEKELQKAAQSCNDALSELYGYDIIFPKYRNLAAVAQMYEYLCAGRCSELEGHGGAYYLYEQELRQNIIMDKPDTIIEEPETIKRNQYMLYSAIQSCKNRLSSIAISISQISDYDAFSTSSTIIKTENSAIIANCEAILSRYTSHELSF